MLKLASLALTAVVGAAGLANSAPAQADPYVRVAVGLPRVVVVEPAGYGYAHGPYWAPYWRRDYDRYRFEHYRHWDHDGRWDRR